MRFTENKTNKNQFKQNIRNKFKEWNKEKEIKDIMIKGEKFYIFPKVFSPKIFLETKWFGEEVSKIIKDKSLLEVGVGTGLISYICSKNGAKVEGVDINKHAVENTKFNFKKSGMKINVYESDVYDNIPENKKYDFIFWNHPFHFGEQEEEEVLLKSIFDFKYKALTKYISEAKKHLKEDGRLLLGTGDIADLEKIKQIAKENNYEMKVLKVSEQMDDCTELKNAILEFI